MAFMGPLKTDGPFRKLITLLFSFVLFCFIENDGEFMPSVGHVASECVHEW